MLDSSNCQFCGTANFRDCKHRPAFAPVPASVVEREKVDQRTARNAELKPGLFDPSRTFHR